MATLRPQNLMRPSRSNIINFATPIVRMQLDPRPKPNNIAQGLQTAAVATDESHPFHPILLRRWDAWSPDRLHWNVRCPISVSKYGVVRQRGERRVRVAFTEELKRCGRDAQGRVVGSQGGAGDQIGQPLRGAVSLMVQELALTAPYATVQRGCRDVLKRIMDSQERGLSERSSGSKRGPSDRDVPTSLRARFGVR